MFDQVPLGSLHRHTKSGAVYTVIGHSNVEGTKPEYPPTVHYRNVVNGKEYSRRLSEWSRSFERIFIHTLFAQLAAAQDTPLSPEIVAMASVHDGAVAQAITHSRKVLADQLIAARQEGVNEGLEKAAKCIAPLEPRPCDCERCTCGNIGDAEAVAFWDSSKLDADAIRALKTAPTTGASDDVR